MKKREKIGIAISTIFPFVLLIVLLSTLAWAAKAGKTGIRDFVALILTVGVVVFGVPLFWSLKICYLRLTGHEKVDAVFPDHDWELVDKKYVGTVHGVPPPYDAEYEYTYICRVCGKTKTGYGIG